MVDAVRNLICRHIWLESDRILAEPLRERRRALLDVVPEHLRAEVESKVRDRFYKKV